MPPAGFCLVTAVHRSEVDIHDRAQSSDYHDILPPPLALAVGISVDDRRSWYEWGAGSVLGVTAFGQTEILGCLTT